ncbi:MAG: NAD(P)H-dependent oxidoreductase subunit E [Clostridiaceae bacterium]|nr:NAD(P)H-dependent oxidoreductase subunit E [Clostridiaceae bacterium]MBW4860992.1 NAD(P)H-dependent oxidoreductase subunit E [Clostridiaceae bacterium]MBW4867617.1 NAD(P)H-dependent oxidoreductase subunit E [Clostridiaceae bacterium]
MEFLFDWEANEEKVRQFKIYIEENRNKKGALMAVLHEAQNLFGHIPIEIQKMISEELKIPLSEIYGVVTFYSQFSLIPKGKYEIGICLGTACYVKGSKDVLNKVEEILDVGVGETTADGKFSISATRCLGACGLAPVLVVNDDVYGKITPNDVEGILNKYK